MAEFKTGDRVALFGTVEFERAGFVWVRRDDGARIVAWGADVTLVERGPNWSKEDLRRAWLHEHPGEEMPEELK